MNGTTANLRTATSLRAATSLKAVSGLPDLAVLRTLGPTPATARHAHDSLVLGAVLSGSRRLSWDGGLLDLSPGQGYLLPPGLGHACRDKEEVRAICICLGPETRQMLDMAGPWPRRVLDLDGALVRELASDLEQDGDAPALLRRFVAPLKNHAEARRPDPLVRPNSSTTTRNPATPMPDDPNPSTPDQAASNQDNPDQDAPDQDVPRAIALARRHLDADDQDCAGLAARLGLTPWRLSRLFRRGVGLTMPEYRLHARLRRAKKLLAQGAGPAYAALEAGFFDQSHLNREFRRRVGLTPGEYARFLGG